MDTHELPDRSLISLTEDEITTLLTLLEPSSDENDPNEDLYNKLRNLKSVDIHPLFVSIYESTQVYGGPEEGGWYYHTEELYQSVPVGDLDDAVQQLFEMVDEPEFDAEPMKDQFMRIGSASYHKTDRYGEGHIFRIEWYPGEHQDVRRRIYE